MKFILRLFTLLSLTNLFTLPLLSQSLSDRDQVKTPREELAGFSLPDGFVIELVASEKDGIANPIDLTFDDAGRLWTQTAMMYPLDSWADIQWAKMPGLTIDEQEKKKSNAERILDLYQGKAKGIDKILILSNLNAEGPVKTTVWADGLTIPQSILPYKNGAFVAQGSELFFLNDTNGDGKADERVPVLTGFGFRDTHTMTHSLVRAPGGWIHFSQGALNNGLVSSLRSDAKLRINYSKIVRFSLDGKKLELVSSGLNNIWGLQLRGKGQWYGTEANDLGFSVVPMEPGTGFPGIGNDRLRPYQPWMPVLHKFRVGGTGISGLAFSEDTRGSFPEEWDNVAFLANPITSSINCVKIIRNPDGSVTAKHLPDLLTSGDDWFRPVNIEFGPDGCLYIADWYDKVISHNELPLDHPGRDKTHGRIWRIRYIGEEKGGGETDEIPDFYQVKARKLPGYLASPSLWAKRAAWHQIADRPFKKTRRLASDLVALARDESQSTTTRIHALWSLEGINHYDKKLMSALLRSPLHHLRREAVRSLTSFHLTPSQLPAEINNLIDDISPTVRSQVIRTLTEMEAASQATIGLLVQACKPAIPGDSLGGPYERNFERFLARRALEQYPEELQAYINSPSANEAPVKNLLWAVQALPKEQKEYAFLKFWPQSGIKKLDEPTFISISGMLDNPNIYHMVKPVVQNPAYAATYIHFAMQNEARVQSAELSGLLRPLVRTLLMSDTLANIDLALDAAGRLNIRNLRDAIIGLVEEERTPETTLLLALKALENDLKANEDIFNRIAKNEKISFNARVAALHSLSKVDADTGLQIIQKWIPELNLAEKKSLAGVLAGSKQGTELLMRMYDEEYIGLAVFDIPTAERVYKAHSSDPRSAAILKGVKKREEEEKNIFNARLAHYIAIAKEKEGNPVKGKVLFQTCLMCHQVGDQGHDIAPALDGSANREPEALLTAILDPDAAVERSYRIFSVVKKDGSSLQGYLVKRDELGTTIAFMGGSEIFIETADIKSQRFLDRSFMVKGLIDSYTNEQVADLLAYIRSLK